MNQAEFDRFADEYDLQHAHNIRLSGERPAYFARYKVQDVANICAPEKVSRILDFGAGVGTSVPYWREAFQKASITCLDVSLRSLEIARGRYPGIAEYRSFDGVTIPFPAYSFDVVFAACVFHHVDASQHVRLLGELLRVLTDSGRLFVFEHNPLNPLTRYVVNACPFDINAKLISAGAMRARLRAAGFTRISLAYRIFFPAALSFMRPWERVLTRVPLGAQYRLCAQK